MNVILSAPHGGTLIPNVKDFNKSMLIEDRLLDDVDLYTDQIVTNIRSEKQLFIPREVAVISRYFVDLNRPSYESVFFWKKTSNGQPLWKKEEEFNTNFYNYVQNKYYWPYYRKLQEYLFNVENPILLDIHSMPAYSTEYHTSRTGEGPNTKRPEICISNCSEFIKPILDIQFLKDIQLFFSYNNYYCKINDPYKGGFITKYFGGTYPAMQIEINRNLLRSKKGIEEITELLSNLVAEINGKSITKDVPKIEPSVKNLLDTLQTNKLISDEKIDNLSTLSDWLVREKWHLVYELINMLDVNLVPNSVLLKMYHIMNNDKKYRDNVHFKLYKSKIGNKMKDDFIDLIHDML